MLTSSSLKTRFPNLPLVSDLIPDPIESNVSMVLFAPPGSGRRDTEPTEQRAAQGAGIVRCPWRPGESRSRQPGPRNARGGIEAHGAQAQGLHHPYQQQSVS